MSVKANVVANYVGQLWRAAMSVAFIPVYIKYLGIEAYGLMGIFTMLQAWLVLLDMGMRPTLSREIARYTAGAHSPQYIRDLLRSVEVIAAIIAALVTFFVWLASGWLATRWLKPQALPPTEVARALALMGAVMGFRFIEDVYAATMVGLQRQVLDNAVTISTATLRALGAVCVLAYIAPTIEAFFAWQGVVSLITVAVYSQIVYRLLPASPRSAHFSRRAVADVWRFATGMTLISLLALLLTQMDKILLSRMLTLRTFGYYALATTVASSLYLLVAPITTAYYPRFTQLTTSNDEQAIRSSYHQAAQLVTVIMGGAAVILTFFADRILFIWSGDLALTRQAAALLPILTLGTLFNGLMWVPYQMQLAHGWTSLTIKVNIVAVLLLIPAILCFVPRYGAMAAAWIWMILNAGYLVFVIFFVHRRILTKEKWSWYRDDLAIPLAAALLVGASCRWLSPHDLGRYAETLVLLVSSALVLVAGTLAAPRVREIAVAHLPPGMRWWAAK